jgi:integrase
VELSAAEVALLRAHKARQAEERLRIGDMWRDHGLVFPSEVGTPLSTGNLRRWFYATLEKAGLPHFRFHDLRHTAATFLLQADPRINVAQQRLGHRDPAITARFYAHVLPGEQGKAAAVVANRLLGSGAGAPESKRQTKR